jgi:hypothetical protein
VLVFATAVAACTPAGDSAPTPAAPAASAAPTLADPVAEGQRLADGFFAALQSGDPAAVSATMAPEARIARANGDVVVRDDYLTKLPVIAEYSIDKADANQHGDVLVVTYHVIVDEVIDGVQQPTKEAPRLTVFQWQDGAWKLVAHANFGAINSPTNP